MNVREQRQWLERHPGMPLDESWIDRASRVRFAVEPYIEAVSAVRELYPLAFDELGSGNELRVDYPNYELLNDQGQLRLITARSDSSVVGYHLGIIGDHRHYADSLTYFSDAFFLKSEYRIGRTGIKFIEFVIDDARSVGAKRLFMCASVRHEIDPILLRLGFNAIERVYAKDLSHG